MSNPFEDKRITAQLIQKSIAEVKRQYPGTEVMVLSDYPFPKATIAKSAEDVPAFDGCYLLAYEQDDICANVMEYMVQNKKPYFPAYQFHPVAEYWRTNQTAQKVLAREYDIQTSREKPKWDTPDFTNILQAIESTREINGDYVEVGVFQGNSARVAVRYMDSIGLKRDCWFMDVFIGFEYTEAKNSIDILWEGTHENTTPEAELATELDLCTSENTLLNIKILRRNIISDDLPDMGPIAVANLDVDMYEAVKAGLFRLAPLMAQGGILIVEDPGHTPALGGAFHALTEFLNHDMAKNFTRVTMESGQTFLIRTR